MSVFDKIRSFAEARIDPFEAEVIAVKGITYSDCRELKSKFDRLREALQLLYDTSDATPGTAQWEDYELALRRAEAALKEVGGD